MLWQRWLHKESLSLFRGAESFLSQKLICGVSRAGRITAQDFYSSLLSHAFEFSVFILFVFLESLPHWFLCPPVSSSETEFDLL